MESQRTPATILQWILNTEAYKLQMDADLITEIEEALEEEWENEQSTLPFSMRHTRGSDELFNRGIYRDKHSLRFNIIKDFPTETTDQEAVVWLGAFMVENGLVVLSRGWPKIDRELRLEATAIVVTERWVAASMESLNHGQAIPGQALRDAMKLINDFLDDSVDVGQVESVQQAIRRELTYYVEYVWPDGLEMDVSYGRVGDMGEPDVLRVFVEDDGDVVISTHLGHPVQFCTSGAGGGRSYRVRMALLGLAQAIRLDNEEFPPKNPDHFKTDFMATRTEGV